MPGPAPLIIPDARDKTRSHPTPFRSAWPVAAASAAWLFVPGPTGTPLCGAPFTDVSVFAFIWGWVLVFLVLPSRGDRRAWPWAAGLVAAAIVKLVAGGLASPRGLTGTYHCLIGTDGTRWPAEPTVVRPWRRVDPEIQFRDNAAGVSGRSFHLLFYNSRHYWRLPKPALEQLVRIGREFEFLDLAGLAVEWRGTIDIPSTGSYRFCPDTDGDWSVSLEPVQIAGPGGASAKWAGGPDTDRRPPDPAVALAAGTHRITIRYLHQVRSAAFPRDRQRIRFLLRWQTDESVEEVACRLLHPGTDGPADAGGRVIADRVADALAWFALLAIAALFAGWMVRMTDWRRVRAEFPSARLVVFVLSAGTFVHGTVRIARAAARDPHGCTLNTYDYKTYLARALAYRHDGDFVPGTRPAGAPAAGPSASPAAPIPRPDETEFHSFGPLDAWLRFLASALDGRLGPVRFTDDEPDSPTNRLHAFYRNPLMEYYLAGLLALFGERLGLCYLFQALTAAAAVALAYRIGRISFGKTAGLVAAAALAADPGFLRYCEVFFAEQPAGLLVPAALAAVMVARRTARLAWFATAGVTLAAAFLMRPNLALLLPVSLLWLLLPGAWTAGANLWRRACGALVTALVFAACWSLLPVRNHQLSGRPLWGVTCGPTIIITGLRIPVDWPLDKYVAEAPPERREWLARQLRLFAKLSFDKGDGRTIFGDPLPYDVYPDLNPVLERIVADYIAENPARFAGQCLQRVWELWGAGDKWQPLLYLAVLAGAGAALLRRRGPEPLLTAAALLAISVPIVMIYYDDRLRVPALPLVHVFTGALVWTVMRRFRSSRPQG